MYAKRSLAIALATSAFAASAQAPVKIGFITTLSTSSGYIGEDLRDGFRLAVKQEGGKLGGVPVELVIEDDALKPANAKQVVDRMVQSGIRLYTGVNFSNVLAAVVPSVTKAGFTYVSANPGPSAFAGDKCEPGYFVASYQNDWFHAAGGVAANEQGYKRVVVMAPNYQAGRDAIAGFKSTYKGEVLAEIYTKLDQTDFSVELARVRSLAPDAVYQFHPGGAGINFAKQYGSSGLGKTVPMLMPSFSMDRRMMDATGTLAGGFYVTDLWYGDLNDASRKFVKDFQATYSRVPTSYAVQAYDTANLIGSALRAVKGDVNNTGGLRAALRKADFASLRGDFAMANNQHPIQNMYLLQLQKDNAGGVSPKFVRKVVSKGTDAYAAACKMAS
ncbi:ABC transporter substrate-binding protein [Cupriavidus basilensis]|uniref:ABC transporter substrate-binding protein n=1 Tax=Cupriavidus basilensis TaxID=68895 RepID=A0ABT6AWF8_9BURK|nr:ABC transporter substrate-binding protein [Cupriavidus basilensis]MDF3836913.1 ABC transporter substrate-binding protein [Cupriavidus basilensis]